MHRIILASLAGIVAASGAFAASFGPLVTPNELAARAEAVQPIVLDIRDAGYDQGHLPGALSAPYAAFRGDSANPGAVPDVDALEAAFEQLGLREDRPIVIVPAGRNDTDFGAAARVYWTLKSTGFTDLSILNGGTQAWTAAGLPVDTAAVTAEPTELELSFSDAWLASTDAVAEVVAGRQDAVLVDARPADFFTGRSMHDSAVKPGTLPGAVNHSYTAYFPEGTPLMSSKIDIEALKTSLGLSGGQNREVVAFCNTGHWAATEWFALSELAGIEGVRLYPGSMVEYSQAGLPMENVPGLLSNLSRQIFGG